MANDLDQLFETPASVPADTVTPPAQPSVSAPEIEELRRELYLTKGQLAALAQQRQFESPSQPPAPESTAPQGWQDREFLSEGEERLLLESTKPREALNRMFNSVAKTVQGNFTEELAKRDAYLAQLAQQSQQSSLQQQQLQATQHFQTRFYEAHKDLVGDEPIVAQAAQTVAQEYAQQPWRFGSAEVILTRIGEVARATKQGYVARWTGGGAEKQGEQASGSAAQSPARRAAMETGGSTRVGVPAPPKDSQVKAIGAMIDHVRGGRR